MKKGTTFKHLTWNDRLVIERMHLKGYKPKEIADAIGCHVNTIYNELKRATYEHTNSDLTVETRYNPDEAHRKYREGLKKKGRQPKLEQDPELTVYIRDLIIDQKYSPNACLMEIENNETVEFSVKITSVNTIYSGIRKGFFDGVTMEALPRHGKHPVKKKKVRVQKRASIGTSIEKRPEEIDTREEFGHWEMDSVMGKQGCDKSLLVLTERKTREEIIEVMKHHTADEVIKALNRLEKRFKSDFYTVFKTITVDNGSEFADWEGMENALYRVGKRTKIYFCHARSPQERGSNENQNILIRRFLPKGMDFDKSLKRSEVKDIEYWINTYPRALLDGKNSNELFLKELGSCGCRIPEYLQ